MKILNWTDIIISHVNTSGLYPSGVHAQSSHSDGKVSVWITINDCQGNDRIEVSLKPGSMGLFESVLTIEETSFADSLNGEVINFVAHILKGKDIQTRLEFYLADSEDFYMNRLR